jgi:hypothetical protein
MLICLLIKLCTKASEDRRLRVIRPFNSKVEIPSDYYFLEEPWTQEYTQVRGA